MTGTVARRQHLAAVELLDPDRTPSLRQLVEEEVDRDDLSVAGDDEIGARVRRRLAGATRHPADASAIPGLLRRGQRLVLEVGMLRLDHACDAMDLVAAAVRAARL